jgi:glycosyltransferase involved in cell wall biosynthesis
MADQLSIITINYNDALGLKKTMKSLEEQTWNEFEHIIVDGNSSDDSLDVIKSFHYDNLKYISEPDSGIYNAMNKGIKMSKGKYLLFLNSGDFLENENVLETLSQYLNNNFSILAGNIIFDEVKGKRLREHPEEISFSYLVGNSISHPSTFIRRNLFAKYGKYDESFNIVADWAFFLKVLGLNNESFFKIPETITVFDTKGISSKKENLANVYKEREKVLAQYFPRIFNNENDTYIFNKFISTDKRFKYLQIIDNYPLFRKITTLKLGALVWIIKLFHKVQ